MNKPSPFRSKYVSALLACALLLAQLAPLSAQRPAKFKRAPAPAQAATQQPRKGGATTTGAQKHVTLPAPNPAQAITVTATKTDNLTSAQAVAPGGTINYTVTITNSAGSTGDATGVTFSDTIDPNTSLVPGSIVATPIANADTYNVIGNVRIQPNAAQGLLANDFNPDNGNATGLSASGPSTSTQGGNLTINSDGSFSYNPPAGFAGTDTFTYTLTNTTTNKTDTAAVTLNVGNGTATPGNAVIWFVNSAAATNGDGRLTSPFNCLTGAGCFSSVNDGTGNHPAAGDYVFLYSSATSYAGGLTLLSNQKLIGQGASTTLAAVTGFTVPTGSDALPALNSDPSTVTITTSAASTNGINIPSTGAETLRGFTVGDTTAFDIASGASFGTLNTSEVVLGGAGGTLNLSSGALNATFGGVTSTSGSSQGLILVSVTGSLDTGGTTISGNAFQCISVGGASSATLAFGNTSCTGGTDGVALAGSSGSTRTFGTLSVSGGSGNAFKTTLGGGNITVTGAASLSSTLDPLSLAASANQTVNFSGGATVSKTTAGGEGISWTGASGASLTFSTLALTTGSGLGMNLSGGGTVNVSNASGSSISSTAAGSTPPSAIIANGVALGMNFTTISSTGGGSGAVVGLSFNNVTGSLSVNNGASTATNVQNPGGVGIQITSSSASLNFGNTVVNGSGSTGVVLGGSSAGNSGAITFGSLDVSPDSGQTGLFAQNNTGTITSTGGTVSTTNAAAVNVSGPAGLTPLSMTLASVSANISNATAASGVTVTNASGTLSMNAGTITGGGATAFNVSTGTASITYAGAVSQSNAQRAVLVDSHTGGTVLLSGAVSASGTSTGILLSNNNGATINFTGGVNLSTGANDAFTATTGGTINVTQNNTSIINTITTTTGAALKVQNTTIGASGLTFRSITSNGATNGIVLNNTGTTAGLTVVANGGTCTSAASCTGGSIQNSTGDAVSLNSTKSVSLTDMYLFTSGQSHIDATSVNGLTLSGIYADLSTDHGILGNSVTALNISSSTFDRGGAGSGSSGKHGIFITNLFGTSSVSNTTIKRSNTIQFFVTNTDATVQAPTAPQDILTLSHVTFTQHTGAFAGDNFSALANFTDSNNNSTHDNGEPAANMKVITNTTGGATSADSGGNLLNIQASGGKITSSLTGLTSSNNTAGVNVAASNGGTNVFDVFDNTTGQTGTGFTGTGSVALNLACINSTCDGKFHNNKITHTAPANVDALSAVLEGSGTATVEISNNQISGSFSRGIFAQARLGTGTMNATITSNTVTQTDATGLQVIRAENGASCGAGCSQSNQVCLNLASNSAAPAGSNNAYMLRNRGSSSNCPSCTFLLQNFTGSGASASDIQSWVTTTKSNSGTPIGVTIDNAFGTSSGCQTSTATPSADIEITPPPPASAQQPVVLNDITPQPFVSPPAATQPQTAQPAKADAQVAASVRLGAYRQGLGEDVSWIQTAAEVTRAEQPRQTEATAPPKGVAPLSSQVSNFPVTVGTLAPGKSVTITFSVTVNTPFPNGVTQVSNQGTVSGSNFSNVLTDDPDVGGTADPTVTQILTPPDIRANDAKVSEPATNQTTTMLFVVTLNHAFPPSGTSVNFATADGGASPAVGGASCDGTKDYLTTSGTLTFGASESIKTVPVTVCGDGIASDKTLLMNISSPSAGQIVRAQATGTITAANTPGTFVVSELRTSGPGAGGTGDAGDDFVELYNNTNSPVPSGSYGVFKMGSDCNAAPVLIATVTVDVNNQIPARGHYLLTGSAYSLSNYPAGVGTTATGDQTLTSNIESDSNVAVFSTADPLQLSTATRLDAVGFGANTGGNVCDLLREGTTLPAAATALGLSAVNYSFFRNEAVTGQPTDTNDNASDFLFADTAATSVAGMQRLGAPGPENKTSPINRGASVKATLFDPAVSSSAVPNRDRSATVVTNGASGTLVIRRTYTNNTGGTVMRLRFRVVDMTAGPGGAPGSADVRLLDTSAGSTTVTGGGSKGWVAMTLEQPPAQAMGGGVNSTVTAVPPGGSLAPGNSVNVQFTLGVQTTGNFRFFVIVEALP